MTALIDEFGDDCDEVMTRSAPQDRRASVMRQPSTIESPLPMVPKGGIHSQDLLQHYLARTVTSMGNGSTDVNPFVVQLIPLAFSKDLILQLLLTQSAVHRARSGGQSELAVANSYYGKSLRLFRKCLNSHIQQDGDHALELATGALIMCFVEVSMCEFTCISLTEDRPREATLMVWSLIIYLLQALCSSALSVVQTRAFQKRCGNFWWSITSTPPHLQ